MQQLSKPAHFSDARSVKVISALPFAALAVVLIYFYLLNTKWMLANDDVSLLLATSQRVLDGELLHTNIFEVNPPFSVWMYIPYIYLEKIMGIRAENIIALVLPVFASCCVLFYIQVLRRNLIHWAHKSVWWLLPAMIIVGLGGSPTDFGQREQFAVFLLLPWLAVVSVRMSGSGFRSPGLWTSIAAGLCAGMVVVIKPPYFALPMAVPMLILLLIRRQIAILFTVENIFSAIVIIAYLLYLIIFESAYFEYVLPLIQKLYVSFHMLQFEYVFILSIYIILSGTALVWLAGNIRLVAPEAWLLILAAVGFLIAFIVMGKGWSQHALPAIALLANSILVQFIAGERDPEMRIPVRIVGSVLLSIAIWLFVLGPHTNVLRSGHVQIYRDIVKEIGKRVQNPTIGSLSPLGATAHPLTRMAGGTYISRHANTWAIFFAAALARQSPEEADRIEYTRIRMNLINQLASELRTRKPDIVLDMSGSFLGQPALHASSPEIRSALEDYEMIVSDGPTIIYERKDLLKK